MSAFVWKEWHEKRMTLAWAAALSGVLFLMPVLAVWTRNAAPPTADGFVNGLVMIGMLIALVCGSSMVAPEVGAGTLQILSALPVSRRQIWWSKLGMSLCALVGGIAVSIIVMIVLGAVGLALHWIRPWAAAGALSGVLFVDLIATVCLFFAVGALVTMLTDRILSSIVASGLIAMTILMGLIALDAALSTKTHLIPGASTADITESGTTYIANGASEMAFAAMAAVAACALLALSYKIFAHGETLRTDRRYIILARHAVPTLVVFGAIALLLHFVKG